MQKLMTTPAGIQMQLTFWRMMVILAEFALEHRQSVQLVMRFAPVVLWGSVAYLLGWAAGEFLQAALY